MKGRITFLIIRSRTGARRRLSMSKNFMLCIVLLSLLMLASGILGAWKYRENLELKKKCQQLETKKNQLEAIARTVQQMEKEEDSVRRLLGLDAGGAEKNTQQKPSDD